MALLTILLKVTAVLVLLLLCFPAQEARTIQQGQNQNKMYNYKNKFFGAVQQCEAPLNVPNIPTKTTGDIASNSSMIIQKALFLYFSYLSLITLMALLRYAGFSVLLSFHPFLIRAPIFLIQWITVLLLCPKLKAKMYSIFLYAQGEILHPLLGFNKCQIKRQMIIKFFKHRTIFQLFFQMCIVLSCPIIIKTKSFFF